VGVPPSETRAKKKPDQPIVEKLAARDAPHLEHQKKRRNTTKTHD
jgi:hypothetical protein